MENGSVVLRAEQVKKYFPVQGGLGRPKRMVKAVDGVDLEVKKGEIYGLVGETGCGKSTLGRTLIRLTEPTEGKVQILGKEITGLHGNDLREMRRDVQMVFQDPYTSLDPRQKVGDILMEALEIHGIGSKSQRMEAALEILEKVGLRLEHFYRYPHEFSGGQRQRIGLARALILNPKIIICDEPVSALDVSIQAQIINLLAQLQRELNLTVLFISHDLRVVRHITHRVMVMYLGSNVEVGPTGEIFRHPAHPYTQVLTKAAPKLDPLNRRREYAIEGEPPSPINTPSGCKFHPRCPYCTDKCRQEVPELREIAPGHLCACHYPL
mgnify:CR=1 FL=1